MIDTDKYESMRQLFLDFIDTASDEVDEEAWKNKLTMLDEVLAEVKWLRKGIKEALEYLTNEVGGAEKAAIDVLKEMIE